MLYKHIWIYLAKIKGITLTEDEYFIKKEIEKVLFERWIHFNCCLHVIHEYFVWCLKNVSLNWISAFCNKYGSNHNF